MEERPCRLAKSQEQIPNLQQRNKNPDYFPKFTGKSTGLCSCLREFFSFNELLNRYVVYSSNENHLQENMAHVFFVFRC